MAGETEAPGSGDCSFLGSKREQAGSFRRVSVPVPLGACVRAMAHLQNVLRATESTPREWSAGPGRALGPWVACVAPLVAEAS
jgi:hypothetical protein